MQQQLFKTVFFILFLTLSFLFSSAQTVFTTNEVRQFMSKGEQNGIEIILKGTNVNDAKDALKKWGKSKKAKVSGSKKSPEVFIDNAQFPTVSANTVDMYVNVAPAENGTKLTIFTDLGGAFISSFAYGTQYSAMDAAIKEFAQDNAISNTESQLKEEEKILKTIIKELKSLEKDKDKALKEIEKAKALIMEREQDVIKNEAEQIAKQQQITLQQQIIETVKTKRSSLKN